MTAGADPVVSALRAEITGFDVRILEAVNARIETVEQLRLYKEQHGIAFLDPDREAALLRELRDANEGPLSDAGLQELVTFVLDLVKRELSRG